MQTAMTLSEVKRAVAKMRAMTDAQLAFTMRDLSDAIVAAVDMGRTGQDPKCRQYIVELSVGQAMQNKRERLASKPSAGPVDVSCEDGIRYPFTVRVF